MQKVVAPSSQQILRASWLMYSVMALVGLAIIRFSNFNIHSQFDFSEIGKENYFQIGFLTSLTSLDGGHADLSRIGFLVLLGTVSISMMILPLDRAFSSIRQVKNLIARTLGRISYMSAVSLSLWAAFAEEVLFRAALQPLIGMPISIIAYVLVHTGPHGLFSAWSFQSLLVGTMFAVIYDQTQNLPLVILVHFMVNLVSFVQVRWAFLRSGDKAFLDHSLIGDK
jgi:membrane protease YdiL (CAAX protease family)